MRLQEMTYSDHGGEENSALLVCRCTPRSEATRRQRRMNDSNLFVSGDSRGLRNVESVVTSDQPVSLTFETRRHQRTKARVWQASSPANVREPPVSAARPFPSAKIVVNTLILGPRTVSPSIYHHCLVVATRLSAGMTPPTRPASLSRAMLDPRTLSKPGHFSQPHPNFQAPDVAHAATGCSCGVRLCLRKQPGQ
jgi:hypothetical protein